MANTVKNCKEQKACLKDMPMVDIATEIIGYAISILIIMLISGCNNQNSIQEPNEEADTCIEIYVNCMKCQQELDTVIGKFDGVNIDTLFLQQQEIIDIHDVSYLLTSTSGKLPAIQMYGYHDVKPCVYEEGDLDGNGTDEVAYMNSMDTGGWRMYYILSFKDGKWMNMFPDLKDILYTGTSFRGLDYEIAQPYEKGKVKLTYYFEGYDEKIGDRIEEVRDTIVSPSFGDLLQ
ncbi:MAG: hypothetical protein MJY95_07510 [Bacteroidaceae bacterium]|nr:hypothetical protein [Bacteroidaceae bacterium]